MLFLFNLCKESEFVFHIKVIYELLILAGNSDRMNILFGV